MTYVTRKRCAKVFAVLSNGVAAAVIIGAVSVYLNARFPTMIFSRSMLLELFWLFMVFFSTVVTADFVFWLRAQSYYKREKNHPYCAQHYQQAYPAEPSDAFVIEAIQDEHCGTNKKCHPESKKSHRYTISRVGVVCTLMLIAVFGVVFFTSLLWAVMLWCAGGIFVQYGAVGSSRDAPFALLEYGILSLACVVILLLSVPLQHSMFIVFVASLFAYCLILIRRAVDKLNIRFSLNPSHPFGPIKATTIGEPHA